MTRLGLAVLIVVAACTQRAAPDGGPDASVMQDSDGGAVDAGFSDAGGLDGGDGLARFRPSPSWLDGGGRLAVVDVWESEWPAHGPCYVTRPGRLFFGSASLSMPGSVEFVFSSPSGSAWTGRHDIGWKPVPHDESYAWCKWNEAPGAPPRCRRELLDGGVELAPVALFSLDSWTASGFISGSIRGPDPRRWNGIWAPDGSSWQEPETATVFGESGFGTGQLYLPDGGGIAFLWDDGRYLPLGASVPYSSWGAAVNSSGLVVGQRFIGGNRMAVFWGHQTETGRRGELIDVNERGLAVGQDRTGNGEWAAIWYRGSTWRLDELTDAGLGCSFTISSSVNDSDQIAAVRECPASFTRRCALVQLRLTD